MENFLQAWTTFFNQLFNGDFETALGSLNDQLIGVWDAAPLVVGAALTIFTLLVLLRIIASFRIAGYKREINRLKAERNESNERLENATLAQNHKATAMIAIADERDGFAAELQTARQEISALQTDKSSLEASNEDLTTRVTTLSAQLESRSLGDEREKLEREQRILNLERQLADARTAPSTPTPAAPPTRDVEFIRQPTLPTIQTAPPVDATSILSAVNTCKADLLRAQTAASRLGEMAILEPLIDVNTGLENIKRAAQS